jgi:hypothetical protein
MLKLCGIVVAILKMAIGGNFSMSGIKSGHHNLPTYEIALKSDNVEFVRCCGKFYHFLFVKQHWRHTQIDSFVKAFTKNKFKQKKDTNLHK